MQANTAWTSQAYQKNTGTAQHVGLVPSRPDPGRSGYIDSWRCFAVMLVVAAHLVETRTPGEVPDEGNFYHLGQVGVYIFFFLSGFVVSRACMHEVAKTGSFSTAGFYVRRFFRIAPPLLLYLVCCAGLAAAGVIAVDLADIAAASLYVCNVEWARCSWWVAHTWSLAFEEQFYLLFPFLFAWRHLGRRPGTPMLLLALGFASLPVLFPTGPHGRVGLPVVHGLFLLGYLSACHGEKWKRLRLPTLVLVLAALVTFAPPLVLLGDDHRFYKLAYLVSVPLMVMASGAAASKLRALFEFRWVRYVGLISYSIYLWQQLLTGLLPPQTPLVLCLLSVAMLIAGCALLYEGVEKPLIRFSRRLSASLARAA
ncbi:acyltransferase family protein [Ramlibacter tataouinensis]|uniref:Candidate membrane protein n=1 Tax=Ramlibacter tataouinensis (strain ATCC BAA-407 / DSM 14655 / LMG 21543 / TTB310) TaxID=365046 RepID=F5Y4N7_RAMTT|nr:acyltransferase [Ramlibacter tataouinensis]AEG91355.1 candidate membrane protein [Ramlibacter tataouinensis TTB310]